MILMILDFRGRRLEVLNASRSAIHMIFGAPEGVNGGLGDPGDQRHLPVSSVFLRKTNEWFCVFRDGLGTFAIHIGNEASAECQK